MQKNTSNRCVVRLTTDRWTDADSVCYEKKTIRTLKRKSSGYNILIEDCSLEGASPVMARITNLYDCEDGVYEVVTCNESRDWETGHVDDYDYKLVKYGK